MCECVNGYDGRHPLFHLLFVLVLLSWKRSKKFSIGMVGIASVEGVDELVSSSSCMSAS